MKDTTVPRRSHPTRRPLAWLPVLGLVLAVLVCAPSNSQAQDRGSLQVSPKSFVGGQALRFEGSVGSPGRQRIKLQFFMGRPGDVWTDVDGFRGATDTKGRFDFQFPAPAMFNIKYRVVTARSATPAVNLVARSQEIAVSFDPVVGSAPSGAVVAGEAFLVRADSTVAGAPPIPGRVVALQQRVRGDSWKNVATTKADARGIAVFRLTAGGPGEVVYRARADDWRVGADEIGWFPSFPTYVDVLERPDPVSGLVVADADVTSLALTWTPSGDPAARDTVIAFNAGTTPPSSPDEADTTATVGAGTATYTATGLDPDTTYAFALFSRSKERLLSDGVTVVGRTEIPPPPPPVTSLQATVSTDGSHGVALSWVVPSDPDVRNVVVTRTAGSTPPATPDEADVAFRLRRTATTYAESGLAAGATYTYTVFTLSQYGRYSAGTSVTVTTEVP